MPGCDVFEPEEVEPEEVEPDVPDGDEPEEDVPPSLGVAEGDGVVLPEPLDVPEVPDAVPVTVWVVVRGCVCAVCGAV